MSWLRERSTPNLGHVGFDSLRLVGEVTWNLGFRLLFVLGVLLRGKERDEQDHKAPTENVRLGRKRSVTFIC